MDRFEVIALTIGGGAVVVALLVVVFWRPFLRRRGSTGDGVDRGGPPEGDTYFGHDPGHDGGGHH